MISYLEGNILLKRDRFIILKVNHIGYKIFLSKKAISKISKKDNRFIRLFCYLNVKENVLDLYGFLSLEELNFFELINNISGVGPKAALEISSLGSLDRIRNKILNRDENIFEGISGIGKKKAQKIILELSGQIKEIDKKRLRKTNKKDEIVDALVNLGFSRVQAKSAVSRIPKGINSDEQKIKEALRILGS